MLFRASRSIAGEIDGAEFVFEADEGIFRGKRGAANCFSVARTVGTGRHNYVIIQIFTVQLTSHHNRNC